MNGMGIDMITRGHA